jgi:hypothetical protein
VQQLLAHPKIKEVDFSSVSSVTYGAAYLPREFLAKMASLTPKDVNFSEGDFTFSLGDAEVLMIFHRLWLIRMRKLIVIQPTVTR